MTETRYKSSAGNTVGSRQELVRDAVAAVSRAIRKPAVSAYVVLTAYKAHIFLAASILLIAFLISPMVDAALNRLVPPKTSKRLFGLVKEQQRRPIRNRLDRWIMTSFWLITAGGTAYLVWLRIPQGVAEADRYSRRKEARADDLAVSDPSRAMKLYRIATLFTIDKDREQLLMKKMSGSTSGVDATSTEIVTDDKTAIESPGQTPPATPVSNISGGHDTIGVNGRYVLEEELGTGGMGTVYRGTDTVLDRRIALKKLSDRFMGDDEYLARFHREAKALARLTHPAIVQVYDLIEDSGSLWMALEYVDGGDLAMHIKERNRIPLPESVAMIRTIADGLSYAHRQGIIHRDLKPSNILLTRNHEPKISDFGLARLACSSVLTQEGAILGSPRYMSPEQAAGNESDERADIYALGITFYELLAGRPPFDGDTARVLAQHITQPPPSLKQISVDIPDEVEGLIMNMLAKDPGERPESMVEIVDSIDRLVPAPRVPSPQT